MQLSDTALDDSESERFAPGIFLSAGATGEVWAVLDRNLNRSLAIEVLHRNLEADGDIRTAFLAEARLIAGLHHPQCRELNKDLVQSSISMLLQRHGRVA